MLESSQSGVRDLREGGTTVSLFLARSAPALLETKAINSGVWGRAPAIIPRQPEL